MTTLKTLQARFPYMFGTELSTNQFLRGWCSSLVEVCEKIDAVLGDRRDMFRWKALGESKGKPCFEYWLAGRIQYAKDMFDGDGKPSVSYLIIPGEPMIDEVDDIVKAAQRRLAASCMVCGAKATTFPFDGVYVTVCASHAPERLNDASETGVEGLVRAALEEPDG